MKISPLAGSPAPAAGRPLARPADSLACPPDKSVTHRSLIFAGMAKGVSEVVNPLLGADCLSTMGVLRALGCDVRQTTVDGQAAVRIESPGWDHWRSPVVPLDFGNSGTTARLLAGVFAATPGLFVTAFGDASLSQRPMARVTKPLRAMGAAIAGREDASLLPLAIGGKQLRGMSHLVDKASAQIKSALLLAGLGADGETVVRLPRGGRDHTEKMLKALGAACEVSFDAAGHETITVKGGFRPAPRRYQVPGDPSSAAFFACFGALRGEGEIRVNGMLQNPTRTGFLTVLERLGARVSVLPETQSIDQLEPTATVVVAGGALLQAVDVERELVPSLIDEIPVLAVTALAAQGVSRFRGLEELRVKESDRLAKTIELVQAAGGKAWAEGDDLFVEGRRRPWNGFRYDPDDDHRLAMAAAVLAKFAAAPSEIAGPACVAVSFPGFFDVLATLS
jgi:3-phosphoshikimate 1-carboxyvinyltransferase